MKEIKKSVILALLETLLSTLNNYRISLHLIVWNYNHDKQSNCDIISLSKSSTCSSFNVLSKNESFYFVYDIAGHGKEQQNLKEGNYLIAIK